MEQHFDPGRPFRTVVNVDTMLVEQINLTDQDLKELPTDESVAQIPQVISMRQARLALLGAGVLHDIAVAVAQSSETVKIEWEYSTEIRRDSALLAAIAESAGLTQEQLDQLFVSASVL